MEKLKDFFHDFSDIFLALIISSIMLTVLSLNLGTWFTNSSNTVSANEQNIIESNDKIDNNLEIGFKDEEDDDIENTQNENIEEQNTENESIDEEDTANKINSDDENKAEINNDISINPKIKIISIPDGTSGSGIARILRDNGLIDSTRDFIEMAENLNLTNKLKSGSFSISTDTSLEDIVKIITK